VKFTPHKRLEGMALSKLSNTIDGFSDSYKYSHHPIYPPDTWYVESYLETRGGKFRDIVPYGYRYYIEEYLEGIRVTRD
jgi:hypothetical protein